MNSVEKIQLLRGLLSRKDAHAGPFFLTLDLTQRCNLRCPGCYVHSPLMKPGTPEARGGIQDIPVDLFEQVCSQAGEMGTREINLIGYGEPLLHPEFPRLLAVAKDSGAAVRVVTNGTLLDAEIIPALIDSRLDILQVSLWAHSRESYACTHPGTDPAMFSRVVGGLQQLVEQKKRRASSLPRLILHYPITKQNYALMEAAVDFAREMGFDSLSFAPLRNWGGRLSSLALTGSEERQALQSLRKIGEILDRLSLAHNINETLTRYRIGEAVLDALPCYVGWVHARVMIDGTVLPCYLNPVGNLQASSLQEVWNGGEMQRFRGQMITRSNLTEISSQGRCSYCGHVIESERIDRVFRWFRPLAVAG